MSRRCANCGVEERPGRPERFRGKIFDVGGVLLYRDHIIPRAMGGDESAENIQLLCNKCNASKGARLMPFGTAPSTFARLLRASADRLRAKAAKLDAAADQWSAADAPTGPGVTT